MPARPAPRLDELAAEGVVFERVRTQAAAPTPATGSLLTGTYPSRHGAHRDRSTVNDEAVLLAEVLGQAGLETAAFSANPWITPEFGFGQGFDHFFAVPRERIVRFPLLLLAIRRMNRLFDPQAELYGRLRRRIVGDVPTWERDRQVTDAALAWIEANRSRPFFAYLHYSDPPRTSLLFSRAAEPLPDDEYDEVVGSYDSSILFVDHLVGRLLGQLDALGVLDDTIVVVTSDQGQEFYEHRNWGHGHSLYDEVLHVPLIVRHRALPAGWRSVTPAMLVDVVPTILELAGLPAPVAVDGESLVPRVRDGERQRGPDAYAEHLGWIAEARTVVDDGWKLIVVREGGRQWSELYDMRADRGEEHDLLADGQAPPEAASEAQRLRGMLRGARQATASGQPP
jgi:arylsulfatase A-like enzyme